MTRSDADHLTAADMINQLIRPYATHTQGMFGLRHRVPIPSTADPDAWRNVILPATRHTAMHPPLLDQLADAAGIRSALSDDDAGPSSVGSKPPTHLEALRLLQRIESQSWDLADKLGVQKGSYGLRTRLSKIGGRLGVQTDRQVRSWWATARVLTHWDSPAYRPQGAPCPECWETNSIRIRFDDELAVCSECGTVWDREGGTDNGSLDLLGQHVAWCTDHEVTKPRHWLLDEMGYPVECTECLPFRDAFTEWKITRESEARVQRDGRIGA